MSQSTTSEGSSSVAVVETDNNSSTSNNNSSNNQDLELPKDLPSALQKIKELSDKRDKLLAEKERTDKEVEKLTKRSRLAQIRSLVPRVLYRNSNDYENEINKVYSWKGISDEEIADIYLTKMKSIDNGRRQQVKQHSSSMIQRDDQYANFRSVPQFNTAAAKQDKAKSNNDVMKSYELMKRISGANHFNSSNN
jgi:hypothetical protein